MSKYFALLLACLLAATGLARADDACDGFTWDVRAERTLYAGDGVAVTASTQAAYAPLLEVARAYALALAPQADVRFVVMPGKKSVPPGAHAGLVGLHIVQAGRYRLSLDVAAWLDVVSAAGALPALDFQGRAGCHTPHKLVEFELPAGDLVVQVSAATTERVRLAVTPSPAVGP